jgi:glycosyltransferase involved in cell wall biosynthesis
MRQSRNPRVSIGLPVYNGENYLREAIDSILAQTYEDLELVVGDNASSDHTEEIVRSYAGEDSRVFYHRHPQNAGAAQNYNFVFRRARGELFKWAAHDDVLAATFVERCVAALDSTPGAVLAFTGTSIIDERARRVEDHRYTAPWSGASPAERFRNLLLQPESYAFRCFPISGLIRASQLRRTSLIGGFQSADHLVLAELALLGDFSFVPDYLFMRRLHPEVSLRANTSTAALAHWFDTASVNAPIPRTQLLRGYVRAVRRSRLPSYEKLRCYGTIARWIGRRNWRVILGELRRAARYRLTA